MLYYRVKGKFDQKRRVDGSILIANELYTISELFKYQIPSECVEPVNISMRNTHFFFGARFKNQGAKEAPLCRSQV